MNSDSPRKLTALCLVLPILVVAQTPQPVPLSSPQPPTLRISPQPIITPINPVNPVNTEVNSLQETLKQAEMDLKSRDENLRLSAAKLLGKYNVMQAGDLLLTAITDTSVKVRRAAVHSLLEAQSLYSQDRNEKLFAMLGDSDVEIRREISAAIPTLRSRLFVNRTVSIPRQDGQIYTQVIPYRLPPELQRIATARLDDEDSIVRLNVLKYYTYLNLSMTPDVLERRLGDEDRNVIDAALDKIRLYERTPGITEKLKALASSEDVGLRRKLTSSIKGIKEPEIFQIQKKLVSDTDPFVRSMAAVTLASAGEDVPDEAVRGIVDFLMKVDFTNSQIMSLLYSLTDFGEPTARSIYEQLIQHSNSRIRRYAWQRVLNYDNSWTKPEQWMPVLEDPDQDVRNMVIGVVQGNPVPVTVNYIKKLMQSEHGDVRSLAGKLLTRHKPEVVEEYMFDLLIDDDATVRRSIIQTIGNVKVDGWDSIMEKSLSEEDFTIQRAAAYALLSGLPQTRPILQKYVSSNPSNPIAVDISLQLRQRQ
jgi:HEAT repeat protein